MIEGFSITIEEGTFWERLKRAILAYQQKFGRDPYEIYVDAKILPFPMPGIHPAPLLKGQFILTHTN